MPDNVNHLQHIQGLTAEQIPLLRQQYGKNVFSAIPGRRFYHIVWDIVKEPMFILLVVSCSLYFILGEISEGIMMLVAMVLVAAISLYQEVKSSKALNALQQFTEPKVTVIRDSKQITIAAEELVPGDIMLLDEGMNIPADAKIIQVNDFSVNESVITGESLPVEKHHTEGNNIVYQGTTINSGKCIAQVTQTGNNTILGKLGKAVEAYQPPKTLLQQQINRFVQRLALFGLIAFFIIFFVNYLHYRNWTTSLLFALTLAMSAIPEEIPVAFSSFMALGAYKLSKLGIISRQPQIIENLGAVSVICLDKTGTITENKMTVKTIYNFRNNILIDLTDNTEITDEHVLWFALLASEQYPFDAMEKAIIEAYNKHTNKLLQRHIKMIHEYPLLGQPPMMTHVYELDNKKIIAGKGATERIIDVCKLHVDDKKKITAHTNSLASKGYRVIAVASAQHDEAVYPLAQDDFNWQFEGLLALYDPPKKNIPDVLKHLFKAKINVKLVTGDYPETAINIATQVGIRNLNVSYTGDEVMKMKDEELYAAAKTTNVFARMFPDAKLRLIEALKANGEITAMIGDGVNDGPALRASGIGIAMGKKGTEIARQAADLIITDDNLERIVTAVNEGRRIFSNLKKAVRYIISIHIPIVLIASLPLLFGWVYPNIFTPIHVIFMELIMGPTCSIFFEKEPVEKNIMEQAPRKRKGLLFTGNELPISIVQGIVIATGALILYYYFMTRGASLEQTRTIVFTTLLISNVFLTFANRSFTKTIYYRRLNKNNLVPVIFLISVLFLIALHFIPFVQDLFQLSSISLREFIFCTVTGFICVTWIEIYKIRLRKQVFP